MCGISGAFAYSLSEQSKNIIDKIVISQFNRGPDFQRVELSKGRRSEMLLGHNRLSIIDLSNDANQPMFDSTGRYCIVYNGEIYNYLELRNELKQRNFFFKTQSDTEVILNAFACWGIDALSRFNGPFAFAIFDTHTDELWLCRDRFGIRPLFYILHNRTFYFASSSKVLAECFHLLPNLNYAARGLKYLVYEDDSDISPFIGLQSLPSGCYLHLTINRDDAVQAKVKRYYDLSNRVAGVIENVALKSLDNLLGLLDQTLTEAVKIRLRADVPLAISLSGGLDSSTIAAVVNDLHDNMLAFSFSHPNVYKTEGPLVAKCADWIGFKVNYVWPTAQEMVDGLFEAVAAQDAPFTSLSIVAQYLLYKKVRAAGIKVLLGGQGGDESFMGYRKFLLFRMQQLLRQKRYLAASKNMIELIPMMMSELSNFKLYWSHRHKFMNKSTSTDTSLQLPTSTPLQINYNTSQPLWNRQLQDITQYSLPTLLRYEDRNGMGNSVESRLPFMDFNLVELGLALPETIKIRAGYGKWPIRRIMKGKLPNNIRLARYKRGFDIPMEQFVKAGLGNKIRAILENNRALIADYLRQPSQITSTFSDHQLVTKRHIIGEAITLIWLIHHATGTSHTRSF